MEWNNILVKSDSANEFRNLLNNKMDISPLLRQIFVASSPQLGALSVGGVTAFPIVLLQQLTANDSSIHVDLDTKSWIASVHGIAGIPSILISLIMQWKGRKFTYILNCLLIIAGWALVFFAESAIMVIIAESIHSLGSNSIATVSLLTISEMVDPKLRSLSMLLLVILHTVGMVVVTVIGYFVHWKTVSLVMLAPVVIAMIMACTWPESPSWLAWKGELERSEKAFIWLRGSSEDSKKELLALTRAYRELTAKPRDKPLNFFRVIMKRDFYLPGFHILLIMTTYYWSGIIAIFMYAVEIIKKTTGITSSIVCIALIDAFILSGSVISLLLVKYLTNKCVIMLSCLGSAVCLLCASVVTYLQGVGSLPRDSFLCLYCILGYALSSVSGIALIAVTISAELMPVKYRGLGGVLYNISLSIMHTASVKFTPYLFLYIHFWGTFLAFALVDIFGSLLIWKYVPETKNKTLQEIEDHYNCGSLTKHADDELDAAESFIENK